MNKAADFLSRLEMDPNEELTLKNREDFPTKSIEVNIESTSIAQEEPCKPENANVSALIDTPPINWPTCSKIFSKLFFRSVVVKKEQKFLNLLETDATFPIAHCVF